MKYLMSGLTLSVAFAIAVPAWAQTQMTPPAQSNAATQAGHRAPIRHRLFRSQNNVADQLNAQELTILQGGGSDVHRMPSGGKALTTPNR